MFFETIILFENHHESIIDQIYSIGKRITVNINGNCINAQPNALLCCPLKCWPRYTKGTKETSTEKIGLKAPHGPIPPLNSLHITLTTPRRFTSSSSGFTVTAYSSATLKPKGL